MEWGFVALTVVSVGWLLVAERTGSGQRFVAKPLASAGFVGLAIAGGALDSGFGTWVLVALVLSALGDVFLLGSSQSAFLAGLGAFLIAHIAYAVAFTNPGLNARGLIAVVPLALFALVVWRWLAPHLAARLRGPVALYVVAITTIGVMAVASGAGDIRVPVGAGLFIASDLAVARHTFVAPGYRNKLWGLPLYYAAQVLLASAGGAAG